MSTDKRNMMDFGRRARHCRVCRSLEHDARSCPEAIAGMPVTGPHDRVAAIATLRERRDALAIELAEYEQVKARVDERVNNNRTEIMALDREIERLRTSGM